MDWFSILKNQVASTKGKQFQLDFSQPMVEEDDCKKTLMAISERILAKTSVDGFPFLEKGISYPNVKSFLKYEGEDWKKPKVEMRTFRLDFLQTVPEEVCCKAIELFKITPDDSREKIEFDGYTIATGKNYTRDIGSFFEVSTYLEIHKGSIKGSDYENWFFSLECRTRNEERNLIKEICEKLTKELVKL